ncbi:hypothetical protein My1_003 [Pectobacterium phage My1]|uniref:Uncharacterized protein n=1 Tax=Pectobacterium phage My1 TaxID=1204539 RepID=J9QNT6_9CAUD|nr:hypothetical protein My1_003 [Pectobacterium phage My1]AFQ22162.1 hypothetical protein My1_003 [Pectobacterium phage My1]
MKLAIFYRNGKRFSVSQVVPCSVVVTPESIGYLTYNTERLTIGAGVTADTNQYNIDCKESQVSYAVIISQKGEQAHDSIMSRPKNGTAFTIIPVLDDVTLDVIQDGLKMLDIPFIERDPLVLVDTISSVQ